VSALARARAHDTQVRYSLRLALKVHVERATLAELNAWAGESPSAAGQIADVCLASKSIAAAEFLLNYALEAKFSGERSGDHVRHAVRLLPAGRLTLIEPHLPMLNGAPVGQRLAVVEGLAEVAGGAADDLPASLRIWTEAQLVTLSAERTPAVLVRVANAMKTMEFPQKFSLLRGLAADRSRPAPVRVAALRALTLATPGAEALVSEIAISPGASGVRRVAVQMLGEWGPDSAAIEALVRVFADAPADLSVVAATALARKDAGADRLLALVRDRRVPATVLRHRYVERELENRTEPLRREAARLTEAIPPEGARLDALIADRLQALPLLKTDMHRGRNTARPAIGSEATGEHSVPISTMPAHAMWHV